LGIAPKFSLTPGAIRSHAPELGEHTSEILETYGYSGEDIERFKTGGVV
jgi:crotonobetainyl-CoA:carnitine CoA-transferase CaiB-like acyl-CoA transferase